MLIFLDFDGVLHSAHAFRAEQMFSQLSVFEPFFRQPEFADIQFVVSSTWRHNRSLEELRAPFSADFRARICRHIAYCRARTGNFVLSGRPSVRTRAVAGTGRLPQLF